MKRPENFTHGSSNDQSPASSDKEIHECRVFLDKYSRGIERQKGLFT